MGMFSAGLYTAAGSVIPDWGVAKILAHGVIGGIMSEMQGGEFGSGFLAGGFTQAFAPMVDGIDPGTIGPSLERTIVAAVVGGTASVIGGGKFANGAITGAFSRLFNDDNVLHNRTRGKVGEDIHSKNLPSSALRQVEIGVVVNGDMVIAYADNVHYENGVLIVDKVKVGPEAKFSANQKAVYGAVERGDVYILNKNSAAALGVDVSKTLASQNISASARLVSFGALRAERQMLGIGVRKVIQYTVPLVLFTPVVAGIIDAGMLFTEDIGDAH